MIKRRAVVSRKKTEKTMTDRREFIRNSALGGLALALSGALPERLAAAGGRRNVLFIAIDDLNDWTGCLGGYPGAKTPNLDRLASSGVLFTNAHCAAPLCNPSRAALMTGIRPSTSGVYANHEPFNDSPVLAGSTTIPAHFKAHGYRTLASGKIYHGACPDPESWDDYWPSCGQIRPEDPLPEGRPLNGIPGTRHFDWGPLDVPPQRMGDSQVADRISGHLESRHDDPFFLACGFFKPHLPWYVPGEYFDRHPLESIVLPQVRADDLEDVSEFARRIANPGGDHARVTGHAQWREAVRGYLACISFMDDCLGRVIDTLERSAYLDNTIVVLWADHGWHLGEKLHWRKFTLWEEATRNALLIRAPGMEGNGKTCGAPVSLIDIYPTLNELCGLPSIPVHEGRSLMPLLNDPEAEWERPSLTTYGRGNHSLRSRRWRYTRYHDGSEELYDHSTDPNEWTNLAGDPQYSAVRAELARWLPQRDAPAVSAGIGRRSINESVGDREP